MSPLALALALSLHATPQPPKKAPPPPAAKAAAPAEDVTTATRAWNESRIQRLTSEDGWLTLVGLSWLKEGEQTAGSAPNSAVPLPASTPARVGTFTRTGEAVTFQPAPGVTLTRNGLPFTGGALQSDAKGEPDVLKVGSVTFQVIKRGDRLGVRVKDSEAPTRKAFHGIPVYEPSAAWRVQARLEPAAAPHTLAVPNVLGMVEEMPSPGTLVFTVNGKEYRLMPVIEEGANQLFIIFADETNRDTTYGAGRFLSAELPDKDGRVTLDFNRAYNPPCAFTRFATCPLPPRGNRLALRVEAGEKRAGDH
ncbi:DUF1684 domain-containing protein [Corallococcus sp. H22C18031201]|uniref:DUF1684 domain-containing protein n=1 Tax=Citreicoccus inhibens TaxID=2849499 RepID=UPI000E72F628|nr:DUF1684 domain-containing protein [Citreicoccus inhibens]MBU8899670.1 DUF1684 domain-containing protein [Citreicoccus inhibens]RJS18403.1 DUF1684 domain-containing protein [Corallococcus sp. H22C18031201]